MYTSFGFEAPCRNRQLLQKYICDRKIISLSGVEGCDARKVVTVCSEIPGEWVSEFSEMMYLGIGILLSELHLRQKLFIPVMILTVHEP